MSVLQTLAGRECGGCTACCRHLGIDAPELKKPDGVACRHCVEGFGCGVYADRPALCRDWYCGWRLLTLSDEMRPDRSGILLTPEMGNRPAYQKGGLRIVLLRGKDALLNAELVDLAGKCVQAGVPIFLSWGDGDQAKRLLVNPRLEPALRLGDRAGFVGLLAAALDQMIDDAGQVAT